MSPSLLEPQFFILLLASLDDVGNSWRIGLCRLIDQLNPTSSLEESASQDLELSLGWGTFCLYLEDLFTCCSRRLMVDRLGLFRSLAV